jgi:glycosyltransferase involved in cell wall biosynthesis
MRIGFITPGFSASEEDWCIPALLDLVRELARDNEVHVFTLRYPHRRGSYTVYGATVHAFGGALASGSSRVPLLGRALAGISGQARRRPFDVLHGLWADEPGFLAVAAGRLLGTPAVVSLLGGELVAMPDIGYGGQLSRINRWLIRLALHGAACVTAGSAYLRQLAQPHVSASRLRTAPLGIDTALFHPGSGSVGPASPIEAEIRLLHVASLSPVKDQATLLRAVAHLQAQGRSLVLEVVGAGALEPALRALAGQLGVAAAVRFRGAVPHDQLPLIYRRGCLFVLSSRHEAQCMAALEAAACGLPVIGTQVGIVPELAPQAAAVVPPGDPYALASAIADVLSDSARRRVMGEAACARIAGGYELAQCVERLRQLYAEVANRR